MDPGVTSSVFPEPLGHRGWLRLKPYGIALWIAGFFYLYSVSWRVLPEFLSTARMLLLLAVLVFAVRVLCARAAVYVPREILSATGLLALYVCWVGWRTLTGDTDDTNIVANAVLLLLQVLPVAILMGHTYARRGLSFRDLVMLIQTMIVLQAFFIVLTFVSWDFRAFTLDALHEGTKQVEEFSVFRVNGLTHGTGAKLSAFQAVGILFSVYLLLGARSMSAALYLSGSIALLLASILLTGRTGFLMLPIAAVFAATFILLRRHIPRSVVGASVLLPLGAIAGFVVLRQIYFSGPDTAMSAEVFDRVIRRVLKEFLLYTDSGSVGSSTVAVLLQRHWFLPDDDFTVMFGNPATWQLARVHSDVGPVRLIFGTGLIGATLLYASYVVMWAFTLRSIRGFAERLMLVTLFFWLVMIELKEPMLLDLRFASLTAWLMMFCVFRASYSRIPFAGEAASTLSNGR